jgi:hypothetical protein
MTEMKSLSLLLILLLVDIFALTAQHPNIMISNVDWPEEPSIYIDPHNTDHMVAGANISRYYYSLNGGYMWEESDLTSSLWGVAGDPCLVIDTAGHFYYLHLSSPPQGVWLDRIVCQKSADLGQTWNEGSHMGLNGDKAQDKEWAVVDRMNNHIYVTWTQFDDYGSDDPNDSTIIRFSKSVDGGISWSEAVRLSEKAGNCIDSDNTVEGAVPAVGPNGEIYTAWAGPLGIVFDRSVDGGDTWLEHDLFISDMPGGWDIDVPGISRCNGMPVTCCDLSNSPYRGRIYVNWADQRNGEDDTDIWLAWSDDGGDTWTAPQRVNDDPPGRQQFFTWMTIDQTNGYVYFVFYDRRKYTNNQTDVYMAVSRDGGQSFINFKVSETPFTPYSNIFFGDYNNISAHNNVVRPIWTRLHQGQLSVWTAIINPDLITVIEPDNYNPFCLEQNQPNPFTETTYFPVKLKKTTRISLRIIDMYGNVIATLINDRELQRGKYVEHFNAEAYHLAPGVYYFCLTGDGVNQQKKMVYVK